VNVILFLEIKNTKKKEKRNNMADYNQRDDRQNQNDDVQAFFRELAMLHQGQRRFFPNRQRFHPPPVVIRHINQF